MQLVQTEQNKSASTVLKLFTSGVEGDGGVVGCLVEGDGGVVGRGGQW